MLTPRENWLKAVRFEKPEWVPSFMTDASIFMPPLWHETDENGRDFMNIKWLRDDYGEMPDTNYPAMTDITEWRDIIKWPDLDSMDWDAMVEDYHHNPFYNPDGCQICFANSSGIFLIPINMMGWVDGLCCIYEEPEEWDALVEAITQFLEKLIGYLCKYFHPDIVFTGDDFAAAEGPFVSEETFNQFYRDRLSRIAKACHDGGALAEFHCCGRCDYLVKAIYECGYDIIQLPVPNEDLIADMAELKGKMAMTGGWERHGEAGRPGASEEVVRQSVHTAIDTFGKDGGLVFWDGGIIGDTEDSKNKMAWLMDELNKYGHEVYKD